MRTGETEWTSCYRRGREPAVRRRTASMRYAQVHENIRTYVLICFYYLYASGEIIRRHKSDSERATLGAQCQGLWFGESPGANLSHTFPINVRFSHTCAKTLGISESQHPHKPIDSIREIFHYVGVGRAAHEQSIERTGRATASGHQPGQRSWHRKESVRNEYRVYRPCSFRQSDQ